MRLDWREPKLERGIVRGEVIYLDRFGNAITNICAETLRSFGESSLYVFLARKLLCPIAVLYQSVPPGQPAAVVGSSGFLEIAVNRGSAARDLGLRVGDLLTVQARESRMRLKSRGSAAARGGAWPTRTRRSRTQNRRRAPTRRFR